MASLYELTEQVASLKALFEAGEIDEQTLNDTMESLDADIDAKAEGYCKLIKIWSGDADTAKGEIDRLTAYKRSIENNIVRLKSNLLEAMKAQGKSKIKTALFGITVAQNPARVNVLDVQIIPSVYFKTPAPELDKASLLEALKAGGVIPGAELARSEGLRIR